MTFETKHDMGPVAANLEVRWTCGRRLRPERIARRTCSCWRLGFGSGGRDGRLFSPPTRCLKVPAWCWWFL